MQSCVCKLVCELHGIVTIGDHLLLHVLNGFSLPATWQDLFFSSNSSIQALSYEHYCIHNLKFNQQIQTSHFEKPNLYFVKEKEG